MALRTDRIWLISGPDKGIYDALNKGIKSASGDILGFVHSDDFLAYYGVLSQISAAFEDPAVEAVLSDLVYVRNANTDRVIRHWSSGGLSPRRLRYVWMPAYPTLYLRR